MEWLLTYVVHSTALIAFVWALTSVFRKISLDTQQTLWRVALLGPLLTASVHQIGPVSSVWGDVAMPQALSSASADVASEPAASAAKAGATETEVVHHNVVRKRVGDLQITAIRQRSEAPVASVAAAPLPTEPSPWPIVLFSLWGVGAAIALGRLGFAARRLHTQLKGRRDVIEDPVLESFLDLCSKAGLKKRPRLTASPHLRSPIALGRREICLPERAVDSLSPDQQRGMLAHEMAHLVRRDPLWTVLTAVIEGVFFFQPLNHLARRKIQEVAEFQCDDWAARHTGTGVHLAKCLAEVAGWVEQGPPPVPTATAMADRGSPIVRRITRLLHQTRRVGKVHPVGRGALSVACLGAAIALIPGVSQAQSGSLLGSAPAGANGGAAILVSADGIPIVVEDRSDPGHDRSRVRLLASNGEVVEIEVQSPRAQPLPPPPPAPEPPAGFELRIEAHVDDCCGPLFGGHFGWLGGTMFLGDLGDLGDFGDVDLFFDLDHGAHHRSHREHHRERVESRLERLAERLDRKAERLERRLERDAGSFEEPRPPQNSFVFEL